MDFSFCAIVDLDRFGPLLSCTTTRSWGKAAASDAINLRSSQMAPRKRGAKGGKREGERAVERVFQAEHIFTIFAGPPPPFSHIHQLNQVQNEEAFSCPMSYYVRKKIPKCTFYLLGFSQSLLKPIF